MTRLEIFKHNFYQLLISFDQFISNLIGVILSLITLIFPWLPKTDLFWADETFSSKCWRWEIEDQITKPRKTVDIILFFDENHCYTSFKNETLGKQLPPRCRPKHDKTKSQLRRTNYLEPPAS